MCGIFGVLLKSGISEKELEDIKVKFYKFFNKIKHRGPDNHDYKELDAPINIILGFHRLAIMGLNSSANQPFSYDEESRTVYVMCNGEIYQHKEFAKKHDLELKTGSDCEVIPLMYKKYGIKGVEIMCKEFNSEHAFVIVDLDRKTGDYKVIFSEDRFGIRPLFIGEDKYGFYFSSELIGIPCLDDKDDKNDKNDKTTEVTRFKPRHYAVIEKKKGELGKLEYTKYYDLDNIKQTITDLEIAKKLINSTLRQSVLDRIHSDRPLGCLLSGGFDSSIVSAIVAEEFKKQGKKLRTFTIGLPDSADEKYAKEVAKHIGSEHTHIMATEQEFINALEDIVRVSGTFDITTIRASTGQHLVSKWIAKNTDIKVEEPTEV
jgi:asparagine synthase (glutamine-hydrolysing)